MKKLLLTLLGILIGLPTFARDFQYTYEGQTLKYTVLDEEAKTCETKAGFYTYSRWPGNEVSGDLVIPSSAWDGDNEYTVVSIGDVGFADCNNLTSVVIPSSVITLGYEAFADCTGLTSVEIPNSVTSIGRDAFDGCTGLTSVEIPNSVTSIGGAAFYGCTGLTSIEIPNSVTDIGTSAFSGCTGLTSIEIPNSVTDLVGGTFNGCTGLTSVEIPNSVTSIGWTVFNGCTGLTSVEIPNSVTNIGESAFRGCSGLTSVDIPNSVTDIGESAFRECTGLTSIEIPSSVSEIGEAAFRGCSGVVSVRIGNLEGDINPVTTIGKNAFYSLPNLTTLTLGNSVKSIGEAAFRYCSGLTSVEIPSSTISIGSEAFRNCEGLTWVIVGNSVEEVGKSAFSDCDNLKKSAYPSRLLTSPFSYKAKEVVCYSSLGAVIENGWIYGPEKSEIRFAPYYIEGEFVIPESVTKIADKAFAYCTGLTAVLIPPSVTECSRSAFEECTGLKRSAYPNNNEIYANSYPGQWIAYTPDNAVIEDGWVYGPEKTEIRFAPYYIEGDYVIPTSITSIGQNAFKYLTSLTSVNFGSKMKTIGASAFLGCTGLSSMVLPEEAAIDVSAFRECTGLTSVEFPIGIAIGKTAFQGCTGLTSMTFHERVAIGESAFSGCTGLTALEFASDIAIGESAFQGCWQLTALEFGSAVTIGESAFKQCNDLTALEFHEGVAIGKSAFEECTMLTTLEFAPAVTIGESAFSGCTGLTALEFASDIAIGESAFQGCWQLAALEFGSAVTIGESAFKQCSALNAIKFSEGVTIGDEAFQNLSKLTSVKFSKRHKIGKRAFQKTGLTSFIIEEAEAIGDEAFSNCKDLQWFILGILYYGSFGEKVFDRCSGVIKYAYTPTDHVTIPCEYGYACELDIWGGYYKIIDDFVYTIKSSGSSPYWSIDFVPPYYEGEFEFPEGLMINGSFGYTGYAPIRKIGEGAFARCSGLTSVKIPTYMETIGADAFWNCTNLTSVVFANTSRISLRIQANAFWGDVNLSTIILGNRSFIWHKDISGNINVFHSCPADQVYVTNQHPRWDCPFRRVGTLYVQGESALEKYKDPYWEWNVFTSIEMMVEPTEMVTSGNEYLYGHPGDTFQLSASLIPETVSLPYIFWTSTNCKIATVDSHGLVTLHESLEENSTADDGSEEECSIIAESLYADFPRWEIKVYNSDFSAVEEVIEDRVETDVDFNAPVEVYNLNGVKIANSTNGLAKGIYILRQGKAVKKVAVK